MPNPDEGCCFNSGVGDKQCPIIAYVDDLLVNCKDEVTTTGVSKALKAKYRDVQ